MKWLITGGCGFLGTSLIKKLRMQGGHSVRVIDNLSAGSRKNLSSVVTFIETDPCKIKPLFISNGTVELVVGDILSAELALQVSQGCDVIVHFAANTGVGPSVEDPRSDCMTNVVGVFNYLEAARINKISRFIFASSGAPAGDVEPPIHEELAPHPVSPYGASKLAGEGYCSAYNKSFGIDTVALRFGNVYGPGSGHKNSVIAKFIKKAISGEVLEVFGDGYQTRDFIYVEDLLDAVQSSVTKVDIGGETFQIATNREITLNEMTVQLVAILKSEGVSGIKTINSKKRIGDVMRNYSDTTKAHAMLGWQSKTKLDDGLRATVSYFLEKKGKA
jgi:UDP-glucose 4-epimerase